MPVRVEQRRAADLLQPGDLGVVQGEVGGGEVLPQLVGVRAPTTTEVIPGRDSVQASATGAGGTSRASATDTSTSMVS
ncbi:hypothetical protein [Modestobacter excelsi]|uniref:hypothetical protein n=1 Tax=Modestobacter excelsi TaxID=2213161 RepID=UPI001FE6BBE1|nr:hypothetical protein [Modestobacter excelsi]